MSVDDNMDKFHDEYYKELDEDCEKYYDEHGRELDEEDGAVLEHELTDEEIKEIEGDKQYDDLLDNLW